MISRFKNTVSVTLLAETTVKELLNKSCYMLENNLNDIDMMNDMQKNIPFNMSPLQSSNQFPTGCIYVVNLALLLPQWCGLLTHQLNGQLTCAMLRSIVLGIRTRKSALESLSKSEFAFADVNTDDIP